MAEISPYISPKNNCVLCLYMYHVYVQFNSHVKIIMARDGPGQAAQAAFSLPPASNFIFGENKQFKF